MEKRANQSEASEVDLCVKERNQEVTCEGKQTRSTRVSAKLGIKLKLKETTSDLY